MKVIEAASAEQPFKQPLFTFVRMKSSWKTNCKVFIYKNRLFCRIAGWHPLKIFLWSHYNLGSTAKWETLHKHKQSQCWSKTPKKGSWSGRQKNIPDQNHWFHPSGGWMLIIRSATGVLRSTPLCISSAIEPTLMRSSSYSDLLASPEVSNLSLIRPFSTFNRTK